MYTLIQTARLRLARKAECDKWDTSEDKEDHMAAGDYKRVWAQLHLRQGDYSEEIARDDVSVAKSLPYAVTVADDRPLPVDGTEHADSERAVMLQELESLMLWRLPRKVKCGRRRWTGRGCESGS